MNTPNPTALLAAAEILDLLAPGATSATKSLLAVRLVDLVTEIARAVE